MAAIRQTGKINENTTLIDIGMFGVSGTSAIYLIEDEKKCLIDGGTRTEAKRLIKMLKERNAFPPDLVIVTHSHYDHTQAIPAMRKAAAKLGRTIEVIASETAIPLLEDQSYNNIFETGPYENIRDVTPVKEGDGIDIGQTALQIFEVPGHHKDHIAILDEKNKNIFVGDCIGYKVGDNSYLPPFMPPFWDTEAFRATIEKLRQINYESLCLAHFGYIYGDEAKHILDEAVAICDTWWEVFDNYSDKLDDTDFMMGIILKEINPTPADLEIVSLKLKILAGLMTAVSKLLRKQPKPLYQHLLKGIVEWLAKGYRTYKTQS
jgi:glyoxylase-like metal-dependent hydrolase (beta-lactamase superfamily II)